MEIDIKYHSDITPLEMTEKGDWIDLRVAEESELERGEFAMINLGVSMELPDGYEAIVIPRSSTFKTWGLLQTNSCGLIDNSYCGDNDVWKMPVLATRYVRIPKDTRICQFRIQKKMEQVEFNTVEHLEGEDRGGFGSTGVY